MEKLIKGLNKRVKNLDVFDFGLTKLAVLFAGILLVKIFPQLLGLCYLCLVISILVLAARPFYRFFR